MAAKAPNPPPTGARPPPPPAPPRKRDAGLAAWNLSQMQDAIRSVEFFIAQAKQALESKE